MEIKRLPDGSLLVHQAQYARRVLQRFNIENANEVAIPMDQHQDLTLEEKGNEGEPIHVPYKEAVGSLLYLAVVSRPDLAFAVSAVSQHAENPRKIHWNAIKRILKYVKGTLDFGILFRKINSVIQLKAFSDADFAGNKSNRKSTTGYVVNLVEAPIAWGSQIQRSVSLSTTESEYIAASHTVRELVWLERLLRNLLENEQRKPILYMDNQSAIKLIKNPEFHKRTKHVDVRYHFVREKFKDKLFDIEYVSTDNQLADLCTKPLAKNRFEFLRDILVFKE